VALRPGEGGPAAHNLGRKAYGEGLGGPDRTPGQHQVHRTYMVDGERPVNVFLVEAV
jgi:hypothetical protein